MKLALGLSLGLALCLTSAPLAAQLLAFGEPEALANEEVRIPLVLSSDVPAQGVQVVFEWDGGAGTGVELIVEPAVSAVANFVNQYVDADWMALGITAVTAPLLGDDVRLATVVIRCEAQPTATDSAIAFVDDVHGVPGSPLTIANAVTVSGASVGRNEGLELVDGRFGCSAPVSDGTFRLSLASVDSDPENTARIPLTLSTDASVQAVLAVFEWDDAAGSGVDFLVDPAIGDSADFVNLHVDGSWMALGITSVSAPLSGDSVLLGDAVVRCASGPHSGVHAVVFRDDAHRVSGSPVTLANTVTVGGDSVRRFGGLELVNGGFRCVGVTPPSPFRRGDANGDGTVNIADPIAQLGTLFGGVAASTCAEAADANDDGRVNISDPTFVLNFLFGSGEPPPEPGTMECGPDPRADGLGCDTYESC